VIDAGAGADKMVDGAGDDTYIVDNAVDVVTENAVEGMDTVKASVSHVLMLNVENLVLTGTAAIDGTGNAADNMLTCNDAANLLDGKAGNDTMAGGLGDNN